MNALLARIDRALPGLRVRTRAFGGFSSRHQSLSVVLGMAVATTILPFIVLLPVLNGFADQNTFVDGFASAGVFVLLAVGLNVVVGLAGLLDLGYAAFFAIGAYTYAYGASPFSGTTSRSGRCSWWEPPSRPWPVCCSARRPSGSAATTSPS